MKICCYVKLMVIATSRLMVTAMVRQAVVVQCHIETVPLLDALCVITDMLTWVPQRGGNQHDTFRTAQIGTSRLLIERFLQVACCRRATESGCGM